jgi:hypothetical protein
MQQLLSVVCCRPGGLCHRQKPANVASENTAAPSTNACTQTSAGVIAVVDRGAPCQKTDAHLGIPEYMSRRKDTRGFKAPSF